MRIYRETAPSVGAPAGDPEPFELAFKDAELDDNGNFTPGTFKINCQSFPKDERSFLLGQARMLEFNVTLGDAPHPLHIHVNPFRVAADPARGASGLPTCEFWADTLLIQPNQPVQAVMPFNHWTGVSVSHCHILDHEDAGMMNLVRINPPAMHWPDFPLVKVMDEPFTPKRAMDALRAAWPQSGSAVPASVPGKVSVFFFLPVGPNKDFCPHCSQAVEAAAKLRRCLKDPAAVRVVVVSATEPGALPDPESLGLLKAHDVMCSDPELRAFEPFALIDSTPSLDEHGDVHFPNAFVGQTRKLRQPSDLMHGLFIVDAKGMVVSVRRAFSAFDDAEQIMREIELAKQGREAILAAYSKAVQVRRSDATSKRVDLQRSRFEERLKKFDAR